MKDYGIRIIIEGVDGSGKSTLITELVELTSFDVIHCTDKAEDKSLKAHKQLLTDNFETIFDRHFLSELIYPTIFEREPQISAKEAANFITELYEWDTVLIILLPSFEFVKHNLEARKNEPKKIMDKLDYLYTWYEEAAKTLIKFKNVYVVDPTKETPEDILRMIGFDAKGTYLK